MPAAAHTRQTITRFPCTQRAAFLQHSVAKHYKCALQVKKYGKSSLHVCWGKAKVTLGACTWDCQLLALDPFYFPQQRLLCRSCYSFSYCHLPIFARKDLHFSSFCLSKTKCVSYSGCVVDRKIWCLTKDSSPLQGTAFWKANPSFFPISQTP